MTDKISPENYEKLVKLGTRLVSEGLGIDSVLADLTKYPGFTASDAQKRLFELANRVDDLASIVRGIAAQIERK